MYLPDDAGGFHCPRWAELPALSLYMDQVLIVLEEVLAPSAGAGESPLTPAMINNYVKQKLVPPPVKKKYGREQLAILIEVSLLKRVLSMSEITGLMAALDEKYGVEAGYNLFCERLEAGLQAVFDPAGGHVPLALGADGPQAALNAAVSALCGKLYVQAYLARQPRPEKPEGKPEKAAGKQKGKRAE